ncbi:MAG: hypothetical protein V3U03_11650 [Myxococcota bacterium]
MRNFSGFRWALAIACAPLLLSGTSAPAGTGGVKVMRSIPFADGSGASDKVKSECRLESRVPEFLSKFAGDVELVEGRPGNQGRVLEMSITHVHAPSGGAFSGPKILTVKGRLLEDGKEISNFTATRYSGGGVFGGYKGTCSIVGRCAKAIGKDISKWLQNPAKDAHLGDG